MFVFFIISLCFLISSSENIPPNNGVFLMNEINLLHLFFLIKSLRYLSDQKALHWTLQIRSSLSLSSNNFLWIKSSCFNSNSRFSFRNINASLTMRSDQELKALYKFFIVKVKIYICKCFAAYNQICCNEVIILKFCWKKTLCRILFSTF